jgi:DNA replication and repair protein RecF
VDSSPPSPQRLCLVRLQSFRNYGEATVQVGEGFNVVFGKNAQGKTNFLEALYLLSTTRMLRGIRDAEAIREGSDRAEVRAELDAGRTEVAMVIERGTRKRAQLNGMNLPRAADILGRMPSASFSSADLPVVAGEPSHRRMFLDIELSQLYPAYLRHLTAYKRSLEQRNALLKRAQAGHVPDEAFEPWEAQLALHGAAIRVYRSGFTDDLLPHARAVQAELGEGEELALRYAAKDDAFEEGDLAGKLDYDRRLDIHRGTTGSGPHRDDLAMEIGGREARLFGSQGQQRSAVISLKLATLELVREKLGEPPLLLLDDILSDLDEGRRRRLTEWVFSHAGQAVLTCTEAEAAGPAILGRANVFHVEAGTITPL